MFSTKLTRVATRATCAAPIPTASTAAQRTSSCIAARRPHQRRHSSSKTSCPPENSPSGAKPAPATKASGGADGEAPIAEPTSQQRTPKRISRTKRSPRAAAVDKAENQFAGLPSVPSTQHMEKNDVYVSSFFALHRPLSLATTIPPVASSEAFSSIFESRKEVDPWENGNSAERRPEDVVYALGSLFDNLDGSANEVQDDSVRWEVIQESPSNQDGVKHLDGAPRLKSLEEQIAAFKPFQAPPPPQPFPEQSSASLKKKASKPRQRSYETTFILTEVTSASGERTYTGSFSPITRIPSAHDQTTVGETTSPSKYPFRERMNERIRAYQLRQQHNVQDKPGAHRFIRRAPSARRAKMLLISVKRQRKLKMKKHKYKKLMKRTRNLRRRQDRA
ncbi:hypothetical protein DOTSEDRAFT_164431 [Dothistroma septosporum NZE10]|uniref:Small ribosomal subunit protein mS38 n=1 Tax=Dothistroma septosporum (strain NZE10 / CBS 128990) TaxID=675120 RepID=N1Q4W0_DOTSN|nr:hypothetical protein DOTSEDRAFT_164431 [Dothistroma septosporum NZE10]